MIMLGKDVWADSKDINTIRSILAGKIISYLKQHSLLKKTRTKPIVYKK